MLSSVDRSSSVSSSSIPPAIGASVNADDNSSSSPEFIVSIDPSSSSSSQGMRQLAASVSSSSPIAPDNTAATLSNMTKNQKKAANKETRKLIGQQHAEKTKQKEMLEAEKLKFYKNMNDEFFGAFLPKQTALMDIQQRYFTSMLHNKENTNPNT